MYRGLSSKYTITSSLCLHHCNELTLRQIIKKIDGDSTGPRGFKGPIGRKLAECENLSLAKFKKNCQ